MGILGSSATVEVEGTSRTNKAEPEPAPEEEAGAAAVDEPPSSWHHAMRLNVLDESQPKAERVGWYCSSFILVCTQVLVLIAFTSSLSFRRCTSSEDCLLGSYCAAQFVHSQIGDSTPSARNGAMISKGTCFPCGSRLADGVEVLKLLESTCISMGYTDVASERSAKSTRRFLVSQSASDGGGVSSAGDCVSFCTANCTLTATTGGPPDSQHLSTYTADDKTCAAECTTRCAAALPLAAQAALSTGQAKMGSAGFKGSDASLYPYLSWRSTALQCRECPASVREDVTYMTAGEYEALTVMKMSFFDYIALLLAAVIVALTCFREIRDINVGEFMTRQRADDGKPISWEACLVRYAIGFITFLRRYVLMTSVLTTVVLMVTRLGGDTVSVMLNTMATLFMLELDNLSFDSGLAVLTKQNIEDRWSVKIGPKQRSLLTYSRRYHVLLLTCVIPILISTARFIETSEERTVMITYVFLGIIAGGELIELQQVWPRRTRSANTQRVVCYVLKVGAIAGVKWVLLKDLMHGLPASGW